MDPTNCGQLPEQDWRKVWTGYGRMNGNSTLIDSGQSCSTLSTAPGTTSPQPDSADKLLKIQTVFRLSPNKFVTHQSSTIFTGA